MEKLTSIQQHDFDSFIIKCVTRNAVLPHSVRLGLTQRYTIQELVHMNAKSLEDIGDQLDIVNKKHGGSRFRKKDNLEIPLGSGIKVDEWLNFIEIAIIRAESKEQKKQKEDEIKHLEKQLEELKTPDEKKAELQDRLAQLKS